MRILLATVSALLLSSTTQAGVYEQGFDQAQVAGAEEEASAFEVSVPAEPVLEAYLEVRLSGSETTRFAVGATDGLETNVSDQVDVDSTPRTVRLDITRLLRSAQAAGNETINVECGPGLAGGTASVELREVATGLVARAVVVTERKRPLGTQGSEVEIRKVTTQEPIAIRELAVTAFPNPFNPSTTIRLEVPHAGKVRVEVLSLRGRRVATLHSGNLPRGIHDIVWRGTDEKGSRVASGTYIYRVVAGNETRAGKLLLLK